MKQLAKHLGILALLVSAACSSHGARGIADKRSDFRKFIPMGGDPARFGLKAVRPFFRTANRPQILRAIENACLNTKKRGSSVYRPETQSGYYVNCNPRNRQLLNGYVPAVPGQAPHGGASTSMGQWREPSRPHTPWPQ